MKAQAHTSPRGRGDREGDVATEPAVLDRWALRCEQDMATLGRAAVLADEAGRSAAARLYADLAQRRAQDLAAIRAELRNPG